jgi:hypothetical protein
LAETGTEGNLRRMMQFADSFSNFEMVVTLSRQLSWSHFLVLIPSKDITPLRHHYSAETASNQLGVTELRLQISKQTCERTEISNIQRPQVILFH